MSYKRISGTKVSSGQASHLVTGMDGGTALSAIVQVAIDQQPLVYKPIGLLGKTDREFISMMSTLFASYYFNSESNHTATPLTLKSLVVHVSGLTVELQQVFVMVLCRELSVMERIAQVAEVEHP